MSDLFEKRKRMEYLLNTLDNKTFVREHFNGVCNWLNEKGNLYLPAFKIPETGNNGDDFPFKKRRYAKKDMAAVIVDYTAALRDKVRSARRRVPGLFERNLIFVQRLLGLSDPEKEFLGFLVRLECDDEISGIMSEMDSPRYHVNLSEAAMMAGVSRDRAAQMCRRDSALAQLGLIDIDSRGTPEASDIAKTFYSTPFKSEDEVRRFLIGTPAKPTLDMIDFAHIPQAGILLKLLTSSLAGETAGINILLYGEPGTGKTEFAKTLANSASAPLYSMGENGNSAIEREYDSRFYQLTRAQRILGKNSGAVLMVDEADDILNGDAFSSSGRREPLSAPKLRVNRMLENNILPTIWISNNICDMDKAFLRRFTFAVNFKRPPQSTVANIWRKSLHENGLPADEKTAKNFVGKYSLSPSFIATAVKSARLINGGIDEVEQTLDALQEAYNNGRVNKKDGETPETDFNPALLNTDTDMIRLADGVERLGRKDFSLCLYGVSGTGKSAFATYLARRLGLPVVKKRCSDLLSPYVGEAEINIARAFNEARDKEALLIFDEADSFLQDRTGAAHSWEISLVNEMLTQMERHDFPFVCTTNLIDRIDKAALRRFTFKVRCDCLTDEQRSLCFEHFFKIKGADLNHLPSLTPGDFAVVREKAMFFDCLNDKRRLIEMLEIEQKNKSPVKHKIGF